MLHKLITDSMKF